MKKENNSYFLRCMKSVQNFINIKPPKRIVHSFIVARIQILVQLIQFYLPMLVCVCARLKHSYTSIDVTLVDYLPCVSSLSACIIQSTMNVQWIVWLIVQFWFGCIVIVGTQHSFFCFYTTDKMYGYFVLNQS